MELKRETVTGVDARGQSHSTSSMYMNNGHKLGTVSAPFQHDADLISAWFQPRFSMVSARADTSLSLLGGQTI